MDRAAGRPGGRAGELRRTGGGAGPAAGGPGRRPGVRPQCRGAVRAVPPGGTDRRDPGRLPLGNRDQTLAAVSRRGNPIVNVVPCGYGRLVTASPTRPMASLWRMRSYIRPHIWTMVWMLVAAAAGTAAGIAVPLVVQRVVDGPVRHGQVGGLLLLGALALLFGVIEAG